MTWKSYVIASGVTLVGTYLVSTPPAVVPQRAASVQQRAAAPAPAPAVDIQAEAARLQTRVRAETEYQDPSRNPFRYMARRPVARAPVREPQIVEEPEVTPPPVPQLPSITLAGIAAKTMADGGRQRTAIVMTSAGPLEVKDGDAVGTEYRVVRVEEDAIELVATDGTRRRISLRP